MFFHLDDQGSKPDGVKSYLDICDQLGVTPPATITEQGEFGYCFEFHGKMHGSPVVYINHSNNKKRIGKDVPSIYLTDPATWQRGKDKIKSKDGRDAIRVVGANVDLFLALYDKVKVTS